MGIRERALGELLARMTLPCITDAHTCNAAAAFFKAATAVPRERGNQSKHVSIFFGFVRVARCF